MSNSPTRVKLRYTSTTRGVSIVFKDADDKPRVLLPATDDVLLGNTYLSRAHVAALMPALQQFVQLGTLPTARKRTAFLDLDGVLADFDHSKDTERRRVLLGALDDGRWEKRVLGSYDLSEDEMWSMIADAKTFFLDLRPTAWAFDLVSAVRQAGYEPVVLTGVPTSVPDAAEQKVAWCQRYLPGTSVITCRSRDKSLYCQPGDVILDDRPAYQDLWEDAGGTWIHFDDEDPALGIADLIADLNHREADRLHLETLRDKYS